MKKLSMGFLIASILVFVNIPQVHAAVEGQASEWNIPFIGTMKAPEGFSAVEVKDFRGLVDQEKAKLSETLKNGAAGGNTPLPPIPADAPAILTEVLPTDTDSAAKRFLKSDFAFYHLSMDDGEAFHTAWFLAVRDGGKIPAALSLFNQDLTPEQTEKLTELKKWADENAQKAQYTDDKNKVSVKMLEMMPVQPYSLNNGTIWTSGGRVMISYENMPFVFFARAYAMSIDNRLTVGILAGMDGERPFWDPLVREMLLGLKEVPAAQ